MFLLIHQEVVGQVDHAAWCMVTGWMAKVSEGWISFYLSTQSFWVR